MTSPIFPPSPTRPATQYVAAINAIGLAFARDALPLHTWLAVGALLAALVAHLVSARVALLVPSAYLIATTADTLLVVLGLKANPRMARVARTKFASSRTLLPPAGAYGDDDDDGSQAGAKRGSGVVVLLIGATSHHPLGILAPGFGAVGDYMVRMQRELDARRDEYGLLASSAWLSAEQVSGNGNLAVMYFRDYAGLHKFAHSDLHRAAWRLWSKLAATHGHLHIWHELFDAPPGRWESIHVNGPPNMLTAATVPRPYPGAGDGGEDEARWESVAVDATRGAMSSSKGRMGMTDGTDNDVYGEKSYAQG